MVVTSIDADVVGKTGSGYSDVRSWIAQPEVFSEDLPLFQEETHLHDVRGKEGQGMYRDNRV